MRLGNLNFQKQALEMFYKTMYNVQKMSQEKTSAGVSF